MTAKQKKILILGGGAFVALVLAAFLFAVNLAADFCKPRIESVASEATGLDVRIQGKMAISFLPLGLSAEDVHVENRGAEIASLKRIRLGVELMPLLKKELRVTSCDVEKPTVTIVKASDGTFNFQGGGTRSTGGPPVAAFSLNDLKLSNGALVHLDEKTGEKTEFRDLNLAINDLVIGSTSGSIIRGSSFTGSLDCKEMRKGNLRIDNVKSSMNMEKGVIHLTPLTMDIFGSRGEGDVTVDESEADAVYGINLRVSRLDFAKLEESFGGGKVIGGRGDLNASLTMKERKNRNPMSEVAGTLSLRGDDLVTYTVDLDKVLSSYEASQQFSLVDLGAFFIAGPLSVIALRGYGFAAVLRQASGGQGTIMQFISHWKIKDGVAEATDCALATRHTRVALKGKLDLVNGRYEDGAIVALLDEKGCAKLQQGIGGLLGSPQVGGAAGAAKSLGGPFTDLFKRARRLVQGGKCEVFYSGAVRQPPG